MIFALAQAAVSCQASPRRSCLPWCEITNYDEPGELVVQSPSVVLGYLNNDKANAETFIDDTDGKGKWMRTGDEAVIRKAPSGNEHVVIVDRIKELIKVKVTLSLLVY
jgi:acyl-CoA synthetase (AMP-forming)/AMP-acid ligase II